MRKIRDNVLEQRPRPRQTGKQNERDSEGKALLKPLHETKNEMKEDQRGKNTKRGIEK